LVEETLPLREISIESAREKSIRHGHINTLHIWWARKPLIASRAIILASLIKNPGDEKERRKLLNFLVNFCTWEKSNDSTFIEKANQMLLADAKGETPKFLDCFAGGGNIPFEALRIGCDVYALDLNPVAVLIELCTLVYPQKYGKPSTLRTSQKSLQGSGKVIPNLLLHDVEKWGNWVLRETTKEISRFYPSTRNTHIPIAYIWARTIKCPNPACGTEIPLLTQLWLSKRGGEGAFALKLVPDKKNKKVEVQIARGRLIDFDPSKGTMRMGAVECPVCKQAARGGYLRREAIAGRMGQRLVCVMSARKEREIGKTYTVPKREDEEAYEAATRTLNKLKASVQKLLPDEMIPRPPSTLAKDGDRGFYVHLQVVNYGLLRWGDLFNSRQALALVSFANKVKEAYNLILQETGDKEYAKAVSTYLGLAVDRLADFCSTLCILNSTGGRGVVHTFGRHALVMDWAYAETNPINPIGANWQAAIKAATETISAATMGKYARVFQGSATHLPFQDGFFDAIVTDPPYYDAVPYSDLSDFFYVWLKRTIGHLYPDLFATPSTPKVPEIIQNSSLLRRVSATSDSKDPMIKDKAAFELELTKALHEINRVLKPDGIGNIVFAHKTTSAWETLINALLSSGLTVTASWPLRTERPGRLSAQEKASLASSVWLVCRKRNPASGVGTWKKVQQELDSRVRERLDFFLSQGIKGADALLSAIGPALEVFGRYARVEKVSGESVSVTEFLDKVREVVAHHALSTVLSQQELGKVDSPTAFYVLWKWTFEPLTQPLSSVGKMEEVGKKKTVNGSKILIPFDDALKLARSVGAEIEALLKIRLLKQYKENIRMLGPTDRKELHSLGQIARDGTQPPVIDMVHEALILWASQESAKLDRYLESSGANTNETFWRVAQALSNLLPLQSGEKQLLDGLLGRPVAGISEIDKRHENKRLDEFMKKGERNDR
jgi:adenine-specific DNA methylase